MGPAATGQCARAGRETGSGRGGKKSDAHHAAASSPAASSTNGTRPSPPRTSRASSQSREHGARRALDLQPVRSSRKKHQALPRRAPQSSSISQCEATPLCAAQTLPDREAAWRAAHWRAGVASGLSTCCGEGRHVATTFSTAGPQPHTAPRASTPPAVGAHARARQPWRSRRSPAPARWPAQWRTLRPCFCVVCLPLPVRVSLPPSPRLSTRPPHPRSSDGEVYQPHRAQPVLQEPPEWHQEAAPRQGAAALHEGGEQQQSSATGPRTPPRRHPGASSAPAAVCAQPPRAARGAHAWLCGSTGEGPRLSARTTSTRGLLPSCGLHTERAPDPTRLLPPHPPTPPPPPPIRWTLSSSGTCASQRS